MSLFGDDAGFWAGNLIANAGAAERESMLVDEINNERSQSNALLFAQRNQMKNKIQEIRRNNLMAIAEYEYDIHVKGDVSYRMRVASERLKGMAESGRGTEPEQLMLLSDSLREARAIHWQEDREEWIQNRWKELAENCIFPKNDQEAVMVGGYGMPFPGSLPILFQSDREGIAKGERDVAEAFRVLTDQECVAEVQGRMQRGPMKL